MVGLVAAACGSDPEPSPSAESTGTTTGDSVAESSEGDGLSTSSADESTSSDPDSSGGLETSTGEEPPPIVPGMRAEYFADYHDRNVVQVEPSIEHDWALAAPLADFPEDFYSIRWTGWLTAPSAGDYTIITETDDGVRVWIDGALIIDDWMPHFVTRNETVVSLPAEPVPLLVEYFEIDIEASARLAWSSATLTEETIPESALTTVEPPNDVPGPKPPYQNPVYPTDCPDPGVMRSQPDARLPGYYMVCTGGTFPIRYSRDLVRWSGTFSAVLPDGKPSWALNGFRNWAPELHQVDDTVVAYYTTVDADDRLCIGAAVADDPLGPYTESAGPLVQHPQGVIDATYYEESGTRWLVYKIDGNSVGQPTPIRARELSPDGMSFAPGSTEIDLITNNPGTWEGGVVEAQWFSPHDGMLYMFYSGNVYDHRYRTGVARAPSMVGPWEKLGPPILANNERWVGPGHGTVLAVDGVDWFVYHAWTNAGDGTNLQAEGRHVLLDRIDWVDGWPQISDGTPSRTWLPWPGQ